MAAVSGSNSSFVFPPDEDHATPESEAGGGDGEGEGAPLAPPAREGLPESAIWSTVEKTIGRLRVIAYWKGSLLIFL